MLCTGTSSYNSLFRFMKVVSQLSELCVIILPGMQILKVDSRISDWSRFCFSFFIMYAAPSRFKRSGAIRTEKKQLLGKYEEKLNKKNRNWHYYGTGMSFPLSLHNSPRKWWWIWLHEGGQLPWKFHVGCHHTGYFVTPSKSTAILYCNFRGSTVSWLTPTIDFL